MQVAVRSSIRDMEGKSTMIFVPTADSGNAMPTPIGIKSIENLLNHQQKI